MSLLTGLTIYKDECLDAAHGLDERRQEHERRFRRYRLVKRPATREAMIERIKSVGATDLTGDPTLMHAPVVPVAGGVAFDPDRMTLNCLEEVYNRVRGVRAVDGKVLDRVSEVLVAFGATGMRQSDIVDITCASKTAVKRALFLMVAQGDAYVKSEPTRAGGSHRKRFYPATVPTDSIDVLFGAEIF